MSPVRGVLPAAGLLALAASANAGSLELAAYVGPGLPTYRQSFQYTASIPALPLPGVSVQQSGAFTIDTQPAVSFGAGATLYLSDGLGLEARVDTVDVEAEITGGRFEGERLRGRILSGGSDWQSLRADGTTTLNVRLVMETDDGALIGMTYLGMRHGPKEVMDRIARGENVSPSEYYMRATQYYETASEKYGWLNRIVSVAYGQRMAGGAIYQVFEIL